MFLCCLTSSEIGSFVNLPQIVPEHDSEDGDEVVDVDKVDDWGPNVVVKADEDEDDVGDVVVVEEVGVVTVEEVVDVDAVDTLTEVQTTLAAQSHVLISSLKRVPSAQVYT